LLYGLKRAVLVASVHADTVMDDPALSESIVKRHLDALCQDMQEHHHVSDHRYPTHGNCTLAVVSGGQDSEKDDIGGDMNHVTRVCVVMECDGERRPFSLIVKIAPDDVLVCFNLLGYACCICKHMRQE